MVLYEVHFIALPFNFISHTVSYFIDFIAFHMSYFFIDFIKFHIPPVFITMLNILYFHCFS